MKYAWPKHRIHCFRKRQLCAYGKQSNEIRPSFMQLGLDLIENFHETYYYLAKISTGQRHAIELVGYRASDERFFRGTDG